MKFLFEIKKLLTLIENVSSYSYNDIFNNSHWVVYEGGLSFFDKNEKVTNPIENAVQITFKIYTWGYNPNGAYKNEQAKLPSKRYALLSPNYKISTNCFKSSFYGYIEAY